MRRGVAVVLGAIAALSFVALPWDFRLRVDLGLCVDSEGPVPEPLAVGLFTGTKGIFWNSFSWPWVERVDVALFCIYIAVLMPISPLYVVVVAVAS